MDVDSQELLDRPDKSTRESLSQRRPLDRSGLHATGHDGAKEEGARDGESFEVLVLARVVLGHGGDGGVETGETGDAGANEDGEEDGVGGGTEADAERGHGGRHTERDLHMNSA